MNRDDAKNMMTAGMDAIERGASEVGNIVNSVANSAVETVSEAVNRLDLTSPTHTSTQVREFSVTTLYKMNSLREKNNMTKL